MELGKVIGRLWATKKDEKLNGQKLLVLRLMENEFREKDSIVIAADIVGAGTGELVIISRGTAARHAVGKPDSSIDTAVVGIVDSIELDKNE